MSKLICSQCKKVYDDIETPECPHCKGESTTYNFKNSDKYLKENAERVVDERIRLGLNELVGDLDHVIINTEPCYCRPTSQELLDYTGLKYIDSFENDSNYNCILGLDGSASFKIQARKFGRNPFRQFNHAPKSQHVPNTRLETYVFDTKDIKEFYKIQKSRGIKFLNEDIIESPDYYFIQTEPSELTNLSIGYIQWKDGRQSFRDKSDRDLNWILQKPEREYLKNIGKLDHTATRVRASQRDAAIIEFMELTNYNFEFAIYVKSLNSITNVAKLSGAKFAMVFTSGIVNFEDMKNPGPTEGFIQNYGKRVHHMAFETNNIEETFEGLKADYMDFLIDLVGSPEEGLKQTFSAPSSYTLLVNEYIHRYGDFQGFFTKSNVTDLTRATEKQ